MAKKKVEPIVTPPVDSEASAWAETIASVFRAQGFVLVPQASPGVVIYRRAIVDGARQYLIDVHLDADPLGVAPSSVRHYVVYYAVSVPPEPAKIATMRDGAVKSLLTLLTAQLDPNQVAESASGIGVESCIVCQKDSQDWIRTKKGPVCGGCLTLRSTDVSADGLDAEDADTEETKDEDGLPGAHVPYKGGVS